VNDTESIGDGGAEECGTSSVEVRGGGDVGYSVEDVSVEDVKGRYGGEGFR